MLLEVAPRGFEEFRPGEHHVDRRRQPSAERRLSKPRGATSGSIPARLISRAAMDDRKMKRSAQVPIPWNFPRLSITVLKVAILSPTRLREKSRSAQPLPTEWTSHGSSR